MREDLVMELRMVGDILKMQGEQSNMYIAGRLMEEAADAIENLQKEAVT